MCVLIDSRTLEAVRPRQHLRLGAPPAASDVELDKMCDDASDRSIIMISANITAANPLGCPKTGIVQVTDIIVKSHDDSMEEESGKSHS